MKLINTVIVGGIFASFNALAIDCDSLEKVTVFTDSQVTGFQSGPENGFAERQVLFPQTYIGHVTKICVPANTVVTTFSGNSDALTVNGTYGNESEAIEISGDGIADVTAMSFRYNVNGVRYWKYNDEADDGDLFLYHNPHTREAELFQAKHEGGYWYFPTNQSSNADWQFVGIEKQIPVTIALSEHQLEAQRRAVQAQVSSERVEQEIYDSSSYSKFELTNGHNGWGNYGFTINFKFEPLEDGSQPESVAFHEYAIRSVFSPTPGEDPRLINFSDFEQTEAISFETGREHHLGANAAMSIGDTMQVVAYIRYSNGTTKIARSNSITLQR